MGILPAGSTKIKKELSLNHSEYGTLGSFVYLGQTIGSALATGILAQYSPKIVLLLCMLFNIAVLNVFTITQNYWVLMMSRIFTGMF